MRAPDFTIRLDSENRAGIFLWKNKTDLHKATTKYFKKNKKQVAAYVSYKTENGYERELHFIKKFIGGGYVAHELFHLCVHWFSKPVLKMEVEQEEKMANFMESITRQFWDEYYMLKLVGGD